MEISVGLRNAGGPRFSHITGSGARSWLANAAHDGIVLDFMSPEGKANYWVRGRKSWPLNSFSPTVSFTRAGARQAGTTTFATDVERVLPGLGFRCSNACTNEIRQSDVMSTQTVTVVASPYTLSFTGTGSVALSGAFVGSLNGTGASNRVSLSFTPSAGSLTLTVTGSVTLAQLELGSVVSDYVPNSSPSAAATAAADTLQITSNLPTSRMLIVLQTPFVVDTPATVQRLFTWFTPTTLSCTKTASSIVITGGTESIFLGSLVGRQRLAYLYEPGVAGRASVNGATPVVSTGVGPTVPTGFFAVAGNGGTAQLNDFLEFLAIAPVPTAMTDAQLQAISSLV